MVNWNRAINAGFLGAAATTVFMIAVRTLGITPLNLEMLLGTMMTPAPDLGSWGLGFLMHLVAGGLFGILYGVVMEILGRSGWAVGLGIAAVHTVLSGLAMPLVGAMHPLVRSGQLPAPGLFASALGGTAVLFYVLLHLVYGAIVGNHYVALSTLPQSRSRPAEAPRRRPPTVLHRP